MLKHAIRETRSFFDDLRDREFARLDRQGIAYLDYTGSALYAQSQLDAHRELLEESVFGNPHSDSWPSRASTEAIDDARRALLRFLDADEATYDVIFTANASAAIKLVAESYRFTPGNALVLSTDNHNSINGIREYATRAGARVRYMPLHQELRLCKPEAVLLEESGGGGLVAFPAQSNFSGVQHSLALVDRARSLGFDVLLDAAAFVPSRELSLRRCPADFVALSFYKIFGYPTGVGALVARRDALARLERPWFAGGTLLYASVEAATHRLQSGATGFEDGTPNFLDIAAVPYGFALLREVGMPRLTAHVTHLTELFLDEVRSLHHGNGMPVVRIYGPAGTDNRGGAVAFNVVDRRGHVTPYQTVEKSARLSRVAVRGGCFCNPGASEAAFGLRNIARCLDTLGDSFTPERFGECAEAAVGAIRVSFGLANNESDVRRAVDVVAALR